MARSHMYWPRLTEGLVALAREFTSKAKIHPATIITLGRDRSLPAAIYLRNIFFKMLLTGGSYHRSNVFHVQENEHGALLWPEDEIVVPILLFDLDCEFVSVENLETARDALRDMLSLPSVVGWELGRGFAHIAVAFPTRFQERVEIKDKPYIHTGPTRPEQVEYEYPWENPSA